MLFLLISCLIGTAQVEPMPISSTNKKALMLYQQALSGFENAEIPNAIELLKQAVDRDANFFMANYQLAMIYKYFGNQEEYPKYLQQALNSKAKLTDGELLLKEALVRMNENPKADLSDITQKLVALYPRAKQPYYFEMTQMMQKKKYEEVVKICDQLLTFTDAPGAAWNMKGYALLSLKDYDAACDAFDKYIALVPDHPNPYDSKGDYFMERGQYQNAYDSFMKANKINNDWSYEKAMKAKKLAEWAQMPSDMETPDLRGAWLLVNIKSVTGGKVEFEIPGNVTGSQVKIWSDEYFTATGKFHFNDNDSDLNNFAGGSYKLKGDHYQETIIYHMSPALVGSQVNMTMELKGDSLIQTWPIAEDNKIDWENYRQETYVKLD